MATYTHTDRADGRTLTVRNIAGGVARVTAESAETDDAVAVDVSVPEAPALALAVLEAAGAADHLDAPESSGPWTHLEDAIDLLRAHLKERAEKEAQEAQAAEREAEDAKVRHWLEFIGVDTSNGFILDEEDRYRYRQNLYYFTVEPEPSGTWRSTDEEDDHQPALRVLQYGAPEPSPATAWEGADGSRWSFGRITGVWYCREFNAHPIASCRWDEIDESNFPMTEVHP